MKISIRSIVNTGAASSFLLLWLDLALDSTAGRSSDKSSMLDPRFGL